MDIRKLAEKAFARDLTNGKVLTDAFETLRLLEPEDFQLAHELNKTVRAISAQEARKQASMDLLTLNKRAMLFDAPYDFDAYCRYIEWDRAPEKRFYMPRRKQLIEIATAMQDLADDKLDLLTISLPPGVGKTTLAIFYLTWLAGRQPDKTCLGMSHNASFLNGVYGECLRILEKDGEYLWQDVFPDVPVVGKNAKDLRIDLGTSKRFETLEFSSIGSGNAGKVRATQLLYCDDLVSGIEEAMSKDRMDKLFQLYTDDARQRKQGSPAPKELHIATRWSIHDVIGRLERQFDGDPRARFIVRPALDENDESNFEYAYGVGFDTKTYHEQREIMDEASWKALFMNEPIEREGQLYDPDELRRFFELPDEEPDAILSVCDTKEKGPDYCVMPIVYQYGRDFYLVDIICDNGNPDIIDPRLASAMKEHRVQMSRFESNVAGRRTAEKVQQMVKELGGRAKITTKYTTANKETKIIVNAPWVKEHVLFLDNSLLKGNQKAEYRKALNFLCGYTMAGKNKHDDVPDAMAMLAEYAQSFEKSAVKVIINPFTL